MFVGVVIPNLQNAAKMDVDHSAHVPVNAITYPTLMRT